MAGKNVLIAGIESHLVLNDTKWMAALKRSSDMTKSFTGTVNRYGAVVGKDVTKANTKAASSFDGLKGTVMGAVAAFVSFRTATSALNLAKVGAQLEDAKTIFKATGYSIDEFRAKTKGLLSDQILVQKFNFAKQMGIDKDTFMQLANVSDAAAKKMGMSQEAAFESLITGTARRSKLILDNVGIVLDAEKAHQKYAKALGVSASKLSETQKDQAELNAILEQGAQMIKDVSSTGATMSDVFDQIDASTKNLETNVGKLIYTLTSGGLQKGGEILTDLAEMAGNMADGGNGGATYKNLKHATVGLALGGRSTVLGRKYDDSVNMQEQLPDPQEAFADYSTFIQKQSKEVQALRTEYQALAFEFQNESFLKSLDEEQMGYLASKLNAVNGELADSENMLRKIKQLSVDMNKVYLTPVEAEAADIKAKTEGFNMVAEAERKAKEDAETKLQKHKEKLLASQKKAEADLIEYRKQAERDIAELRRRGSMRNTPIEQREGAQYKQHMEAFGDQDRVKKLPMSEREKLINEEMKDQLAVLAESIVQNAEGTAKMETAFEQATKAMNEEEKGIFGEAFAKAREMEGRGIAVGEGFDQATLEQVFKESIDRQRNDEYKKMLDLFNEADGDYETFSNAVEDFVSVMGEGEQERYRRAATAVAVNQNAVPTTTGSNVAPPFIPGGDTGVKSAGTNRFSGLMDIGKNLIGMGEGGGFQLPNASMLGGAIGTAIAGPMGTAIGGAIGAAIDVMTDALLGVLKTAFADDRIGGAMSGAAMGAIAGTLMSAVFAPVLGPMGAILGASFDLSTKDAAYMRGEDGQMKRNDGSGTSPYESVQNAVSYTLDPLVEVLQGLWEHATPLVGLFAAIVDVMIPFADFFANHLGPDVFGVLFVALKFFAVAVGGIITGIMMFASTIGEAIAMFLDMVGADDQARTVRRNRAAVDDASSDMADALVDLGNTTWESAGARGTETRAIVDGIDAREKENLANGVYNGPAGFKVAGYDYGASEGRPGAGGADGNDVNGTAGGGGGQFNIANLVVMAPEDVQAQRIADAISDAARRNTGAQMGNSTGSAASVRANIDRFRRR